MRKNLLIVLVTIWIAAVFYALFSIIAREFTPAEWNDTIQGGYIASTCVSSVFIDTLISVNIDESDLHD